MDRLPPNSRGVRLAVLLILVAGVAAWSNALRGPFLYDDITGIVENPHVRALWPIWQAAQAPRDTTPAGRPLVSLSLAANFALARMTRGAEGGLAPGGYHLFNLIVHLLAGLVCFGVLRRIFSTSRFPAAPASHAATLALAAALLWTVHPLQTESVTYVIQRAESLAGLFGFLTLYCAIRAMETGAGPRARARWSAFAALACLSAMASKESAAPLPLLVLLYDRLFVSASFGDALRRRRGLYLALAATWIPLAALLAANPRGRSVGAGLANIGLFDYARTQLRAIPLYLRLALWPDRLSFDYGWWIAPLDAAILIPAAITLALAGGTIALLARGLRARGAPSMAGAAGFLGAWFMLALAPSSSFVPIATETMAEHRMYVPLAPALALAVLGAFELGRRTLAPRVGARAARGVALAAVALAVAGAGARTWRRNLDYRDELAMWRDAAAKRPENIRARTSVAYYLEKRGRADEALAAWRDADARDPDYAPAELGLGIALGQSGDMAGAIVHLQRATRDRPEYASAWHSLGQALAAAGRADDAADALERAIRLRPGYEPSHQTLRAVLNSRGDAAGALHDYQELARLPGAPAAAQVNLGLALSAAGRDAEAASALREAVRLGPQELDALNALAWLLATSSDERVRNGAEAVGLARRAGALAGANDYYVLDTLGAACAEARRFEEAAGAEARAEEAARGAGARDLAAAYHARLELYRAGRPYRAR